MKSGKVLLGLLAGVAAGALLGILFAPDKGSKTRAQILKKGEDYADVLKEKFDAAVNNVTNKFEKSRNEAEEMATKAKSKYEELKKEA